MSHSVTFLCRTCPAELRVPRSDADHYGPDFQCESCRDEAMAEFLLTREQSRMEMTRNEPKQSR